VTVSVSDAAPAIFTADESGRGQILAINQDGSRNGAGARAAHGTSVAFFVTGIGQTNPPRADGALSGAAVLQPVLPVSVTIGGAAVNAVGVLAIPGLAPGISALQVFVPAGAAAGDGVPVVLRVGVATSTQSVTLAVQ
jgi:uncharacterized protein (TIGR03437 family)